MDDKKIRKFYVFSLTHILQLVNGLALPLFKPHTQPISILSIHINLHICGEFHNRQQPQFDLCNSFSVTEVFYFYYT